MLHKRGSTVSYNLALISLTSNKILEPKINNAITEMTSTELRINLKTTHLKVAEE